MLIFWQKCSTKILQGIKICQNFWALKNIIFRNNHLDTQPLYMHFNTYIVILQQLVIKTVHFTTRVLFRLSKHKLEKLWAEHIGSLSDYGETYKGFSGSYWSFSRQSIVQSLSRLSEQDEQIALQMFQIILKYAGLGQNGNYTSTLVVQCNLLCEKMY